MDNAFFELIDTSADGSAARATYRSAAATGGPWSAELQHGGPPNALLVHCGERFGAAATGRGDLHALRLAADFFRPVPVADVTVECSLLRAARTVVLLEVQLSAGDKLCLSARLTLVRTADTTAIAPAPTLGTPPPEELPGIGAEFPYGRSIEWRSVHGGLTEPGPALVWARPLLPLVAGDAAAPSALQRAALIGDSASGVSAELDWARWAFLNIDLDVHVARPVQGEWLRLDAVTTLTGAGAALARSTLADVAGDLGTTAQTLVVEPRTR